MDNEVSKSDKTNGGGERATQVDIIVRWRDLEFGETIEHNDRIMDRAGRWLLAQSKQAQMVGEVFSKDTFPTQRRIAA